MAPRIVAAGALAGLLALISSCTFDPSGAGGGGGGATDGGVEGDRGGAPDAERRCDPGAALCVAGDLETCDASGGGFVAAARVDCPFGCEDARCTSASNLPEAAQLACDATAPPLAPPAGATVAIVNSFEPTIVCSPNCGVAGLTSIPAAGTLDQGDGRELTWFCLLELVLPADVTIAVASDLPALAFLVDGDASIAGGVAASGSGASAVFPGAPGAGGFGGATVSSGDGGPGDGPCAGGGGATETEGDAVVGGGGAGAGHGGSGGDGGDGQARNDDPIAEGAIGAAACGEPTLIPLVGGSGGGGGADGGGGSFTGWPGGGGGGALQLSVRGALVIAAGGQLDVHAGDGFGVAAAPRGYAGGSGGGAGGAILLEATSIAIAGSLDASGGTGGVARAGGGGAGGGGAQVDGQDGSDVTGNRQGGGGGGGGAGVIRLNTPGATAACGATALGSCSSGDVGVAAGG